MKKHRSHTIYDQESFSKEHRNQTTNILTKKRRFGSVDISQLLRNVKAKQKQ